MRGRLCVQGDFYCLLVGEFGTACRRFCTAVSLIPQTRRSRIITSSVSPKLQNSESDLNSATNVATDSPAFLTRLWTFDYFRRCGSEVLRQLRHELVIALLPRLLLYSVASYRWRLQLLKEIGSFLACVCDPIGNEKMLQSFHVLLPITIFAVVKLLDTA